MTSAAKPKTSLASKFIAGICIALMVVLLAAFAGVNIFVRTTYAGFYQHATRETPIPGTNDGFIVQDLDHLKNGTWLFSGYRSSGASPVYLLRADGTTAQITVTRPDGTTYDGHGSGITSNDEYVFLTDDEGLLALDLTAVENASDGATIQATGRRALEFAPAFMNIERDTLYLGNFYHPEAYETPDHHRMDTPGGDWNPAIMYTYPADTAGPLGYAEKAHCVYSIPARIQGMCITDNDQIVLSQSYGLASSHLLVYDASHLPVGTLAAAPDALEDESVTFEADGQEAPLYYLDSLSLKHEVLAPPMSEGIESLEGRIFISCESASDKYLFGKLYGANAVYALDASSIGD